MQLLEKEKEKNTLGKVKHLAVIMDGNRRWAKARNLLPAEGHAAGVKAIKSLVKILPKYGVKYLTAYTFSTENWKRPENERNVIFKLLKDVAIKELAELVDKNVRVKFIGDLSPFSEDIRNALMHLSKKTEANDGLTLQIALNYGSINEFAYALYDLAKLEKSEIENLSEEDISNSLYTAGSPNPEILIRTGGDHRLSNFLLWQSANSYLKFVDTYWPDFGEKELAQILSEYCGVNG